MLNKVIIQGRLVADPERKATPSGLTVCSFRVACDRDFKNKETGEKEADFISVTAWRQTADFITQNFTKGRMIIVVGRLQVQQYTDKNGNKRSATEVIAENVYFGDSKPSGGATEGQAGNYTPRQQSAPYGGSTGKQELITELDDPEGLPF